MILPSSTDTEQMAIPSAEKRSHKQIIERLQQHGYIFQRPDEVIGFLSHHSSLLTILAEAPEQIRQHFGEASRDLALEVVKDPEAEDEEELILFIRTSLPVDQALQSLEQLDDNWWLEAGSHTQGNLGINLEFL